MKIKDKTGKIMEVAAVNVNEEFDICFDILEGYNVEVDNDGFYYYSDIFSCLHQLKSFSSKCTDYISITYKIILPPSLKIDKVVVKNNKIYSFIGRKVMFSDSPYYFNEYELLNEEGLGVGEFIYSRE